ncbi:hypothetical protein MTR67_043376, partial [Solanum verrucosum]
MNPPEIHGSKVEEDPQRFIDKVYRFFPLELSKAKFINLRQGSMSVKEYALKFTQLSKYAPTMVADSRDKMNSSKFHQKKVSTPKSQGVSGSGSHVIRPTCARCGNKHNGKCLAGTKGCYGCGRNDHLVSDCPVLKARGRKDKKDLPNSS